VTLSAIGLKDGADIGVENGGSFLLRGGNTTRNAGDMIYRSGGARSLLKVKRNPAGVYVATITMGVRR